jgi:hypothetical protein
MIFLSESLQLVRSTPSWKRKESGRDLVIRFNSLTFSEFVAGQRRSNEKVFPLTAVQRACTFPARNGKCFPQQMMHLRSRPFHLRQGSS